MQRRTLGGSGLEISTIGLGTWAVGGHVGRPGRRAERGSNSRGGGPRHQLDRYGADSWPADKTFPADDARSTHKDYSGARFQRHLRAVDEIRTVATGGGLSVAQLSVGVLLQTPGLTGVIVGARNARQGGVIASLGVAVTADQARAVWAVADRLAKDLETM